MCKFNIVSLELEIMIIVCDHSLQYYLHGQCDRVDHDEHKDAVLKRP